MVAKHMIYQSLYAGWNFFSRCLLWFALAADLPEEHPRVSPKVSAWDIIHQTWDHLKLKTSIKSDSLTPQEKKLILDNRTFDPLVSEKQLQGKVLPLIKDMLCNRWGYLPFLKTLKGIFKRAVWVIIVWAFCQSWGYAMVVSFTPTFMEKVLNFNIKDVRQ